MIYIIFFLKKKEHKDNYLLKEYFYENNKYNVHCIFKIK